MSTSDTPKPPVIRINDLPPWNTERPTTRTTSRPANRPAKKPTERNYSYDGDGLVPISATSKDLGGLLRKYCVEEGVDDKGKFWTNALLRHILTRERIQDELRKPVYHLQKNQVDDYVDKIHPSSDNSSATSYIKVFAILALLNRVRDIEHFITEGVDDQVLPIIVEDGYVWSQDDPDRRLECFDEWDTFEQEYFETTQRMVDTPYFHSAKEITLPQSTFKPWCLVKGSNSNDAEGAYGRVIQVKIHPTAHSFRPTLRDIGLDCETFAIKTLLDIPANSELEWKREWEMLKHFNGLCHPHLVTALSAITQDKELSFIFPYATSNLEQYLTSHPPQGWSGAIWVSSQLTGLIGAIDTIHDPKHVHLYLDPNTQKKYGRHGDIKCDNVLCFQKSGITEEVIFVITDFGLAAYNSDKSRSNIPNKNVPPVPGYRPPECDIAGGTVSRAFDIWTLGCLFLELVTWFLGGPDYVNEFEKQRETIFINGSINDIFFTFRELESEKTGGAKAILVKPEVTSWIYKLHQHRNCSPFLHEVLIIIEQEMLVVLSKDKKRSPSGPLHEKFFRISERCKSEKEFTQGKPWTEDQLEAHKQVTESSIAVRVFPSTNAKALLSVNQLVLQTHVGRTKQSFDRDDFRKLENEP